MQYKINTVNTIRCHAFHDIMHKKLVFEGLSTGKTNREERRERENRQFCRINSPNVAFKGLRMK
jgi:hypothetical protein